MCNLTCEGPFEHHCCAQASENVKSVFIGFRSSSSIELLDECNRNLTSALGLPGFAGDATFVFQCAMKIATRRSSCRPAGVVSGATGWVSPRASVRKLIDGSLSCSRSAAATLRARCSDSVRFAAALPIVSV